MSKKIGEHFGVEADKNRKQKRDDRWSKDVGRKSSFCLTDGHLSFDECRIGDNAPKIQESSCTPMWYCERWFWILCNIHWTYHIQTSGLRGTSNWRNICLHPSKWKMVTNCWKFQNWNVQIFGFVFTDTNGLNHDRVWKTQSFLLSETCMVILLTGPLWEKQFEKILLKHGWEKIPNWECLFVHREKGLFLSVYVDDIKIDWKGTKSWSDLETSQQRSRFGRTNIFPGSCILGLHSTTMWNEQRYCGQLQNHVRIANFCGWSKEITIPSKSSYFFMVLWYGRSCKEMWGTRLWLSQQDDVTTPQSIYSLHRWPPLQRRRNEICWRIVTSMLSYCSEMLISDTNWTTWYSMVREQTCTIHNKVDQSLWQTSELIDFIYSSHMWVQTILSCGKYCQTMQTGTASRFWLRGKSWRFKIHFGRNIMHFWKYICSMKLDVKETNCCFAQVQQNLKLFLWTLDWDWMVCLLWNSGI